MNPGIGLPPAPLLQNAGIKAWKAEKQHGISKRELKVYAKLMEGEEAWP